MYDPAVVEKFIEISPRLTDTLQPGQAALSALPTDPSPERVEASAAAADLPDLDEELHDLARLAALGLSPDETAFVVINRLKRRLDFVTAAVYAPCAGEDRLEPLHVSGRHADLFRQATIRASEGLSGWVAAHGQVMVNANPTLDLTGAAMAREVLLSSALVVPFTSPSGARGALALYAESADAFTHDHAMVASAAAAHLTRALRAARVAALARRSHAA
jgi:hypothetical protein